MGKKDQYDANYIHVLDATEEDVITIYRRYCDGQSPEAIADDRDIDEADVHGALWYYFNNVEDLSDEDSTTLRAERDDSDMDDNARVLHEARETQDDVDVSEFFGVEAFNDLFEMLTEKEVEELKRMANNDEIVERTPDPDPENDELFFDDDD